MRQQEIGPYSELMAWLQTVDPPSSFSRFNTVLSVGFGIGFSLNQCDAVWMGSNGRFGGGGVIIECFVRVSFCYCSCL